MEEFKGNNGKTIEDRAKQLPVVKSNVVSKKQGLGRKFAETFLADNAKDVKSYIFSDVLIPTIRDGIFDIISGGLSMILYGNSSSRRSKGSGNYINYASFSSPSKKERSKPAVSNRFAYNDIIFETRSDAIDVKETMEDILERFNVVSVADYYELAGLDSSFTDQKYGWKNLDTVSVARDIDGYKLRMPPATMID